MADKPDDLTRHEPPVEPKPGDPPLTPDLVKDGNAKEIRSLQGKVSKLETMLQESQKQLSDLQPLVKKLGELPATTTDPAKPKKSLLQQIEEMVFPPEV